MHFIHQPSNHDAWDRCFVKAPLIQEYTTSAVLQWFHLYIAFHRARDLQRTARARFSRIFRRTYPHLPHQSLCLLRIPGFAGFIALAALAIGRLSTIHPGLSGGSYHYGGIPLTIPRRGKV